MSKILVVDDIPDMRDTIAGILTDEGHEVVSVGNEVEAILSVIQQRFDFAILDIRLHGEGENDESGIVLAFALRTLVPRIQIIMMSRFFRNKAIEAALRDHKIIDFVDKSTISFGTDLLNAVGIPDSEAQR